MCAWFFSEEYYFEYGISNSIRLSSLIEKHFVTIPGKMQ